jgi:omega-6 fatty acid desaturase (delta-12 desaturase)
MYRGIDAKQRRMYLLTRHPVTIFLGYMPVFVIGMCLAPFKRQPKNHWGGPLALVFNIALIIGTALWLGWWTSLCMWLISKVVTLGLGSYLFYAQHNFPDIGLRGRRDWDYTAAALQASSMFDMPAIMHWLTGNIGYHHVHHLNHRIPFYRLPEAMAVIPELQSPGRTSWRLSDIKACLELAAWDPDQNRMLTYAELQNQLEPIGGT